jgi:hypothetical protein
MPLCDRGRSAKLRFRSAVVRTATLSVRIARCQHLVSGKTDRRVWRSLVHGQPVDVVEAPHGQSGHMWMPAVGIGAGVGDGVAALLVQIMVWTDGGGASPPLATARELDTAPSLPCFRSSPERSAGPQSLPAAPASEAWVATGCAGIGAVDVTLLRTRWDASDGQGPTALDVVQSVGRNGGNHENCRP